LPKPLALQGVLALTDTSEDMGGFQGVPELFHGLEAWLQTQPADRNPRAPDLTGFFITPIPARAGDLIIWNTLFPHGNGHNISNWPRLAQYISMSPARPENEEVRRDRVRRWQDRLPPNAPWAPGDPRHWEQDQSKTAELSPLGRKLLGLDHW
jgi:ectoine hydroxylase-related dioxygenase (phytanoyl-CoA dioxygenase family)